MSNVVNKTTLELRLSVNTPDYPTADWLINPASLGTLLSANVPSKYWKLSGVDDIAEMDQGEKDTVDAAEAATELTARRFGATHETSATTSEGIRLRALIELLNKRDNYLTNRLIELQGRVQAMLDSTNGIGNMRADGLAVPISATSTRTKADAVTAYLDDINAGNQDT